MKFSIGKKSAINHTCVKITTASKTAGNKNNNQLFCAVLKINLPTSFLIL